MRFFLSEEKNITCLRPNENIVADGLSICRTLHFKSIQSHSVQSVIEAESFD